MVLAELELVLGEDHPGRLDAAELGLAEHLAAGHHGAGQRDRDGLAGGDVRGAADDRPLAVAGVDRADREAVGVRVLLGREHVPDDEPLGRRRAHGAHPLDLDRPHREQLGELLGAEAGIAVLEQPGERDPYRSTRRGSLRPVGLRVTKLPQEAHVVLVEDPQVGHAVLEEGDPLDPHPEREALHPVRVVAVLRHEPEDVRVDHAGAEDLDPAAALADRVARALDHAAAAAPEARDVHLDARLGEREEVRLQPGLALGAEQRARDLLERAGQVRERDVVADGEPLDLREHRQVGRVDRVAAVDGAGDDDEERRLVLLHRAHLVRRGVRAKQHVALGPAATRARSRPRRPGSRVDVERVLQHPRGVPGRVVRAR